MGLVNLRNANLLLMSLNPERLLEMNAICTKSGYKGIQTSDSIPSTILSLKQKKIDIVLFDSNLSGTNCTDFVKAIKAGFPKVKILPILDTSDINLNELKTSLSNLSISKTISFPISQTLLSSTLDSLMMEKMGITSSSVTN